MHLQALRLILIRLGIVAQTSSIPLCRTHPYDENTRGISLKAQMKSPGKGYTITKIDSQNQFSIGGTESKIEMGVSNPQAQDIFLSNNEATTARKKTDTKSNRTREQKSENFNLRLHDSGSGFSTERVSTAHLTPQNGILRAVEKRKSKGSENSIPREKLRKSRYKREVNGASTRPSSTILTTAPSSKPVIVTVSTSSSVSVPAISASPTPLSTAERIAAEEEEGKSHVSNISLRVDVPKSFFIKEVNIKCRAAELTYDASKSSDSLWVPLRWPNFQQEYATRGFAIGAINRRRRSCIELCKCDEDGKMVLNPDPKGHRWPIDYQAALDGLPETVKNQNEGFRFNAGARTGGLDAWITFTEDLRMFSNRPIQTNDIDFAPPLDEIGPPGHVRTSRIYHDYADLTEPEIDEFGFQNWFGPGDNDFGYFESQYRDRTKGGRYPKPYHGRKKGGS
ncbi:hypothetical protein TWF706_004680 [Orbilia oligospora]|nr:hypothetical protein TWF103_005292 [Orbilia oligospora]KAF3104211.1 hypothetical protein TWF706_004680 [Orbilia oligospora]